MFLAEKGSALSLSSTEPAARLKGYLRLQASQVDGRTTLTERAFKSPIHISKPYWDGRSLLLNVMSPTAGLLAGDEVDVDVDVNAGASLVLSSPTALRIHTMDSGKAVWNQKFSVLPNGFLEYNPEWLMFQRASNFEQSTCIDLEQDANLIFIESYAAGRIAHGERFEFDRFSNRLELRYDGELASYERFSITPQSTRAQPWPLSQKAFFASIILSSTQLDDDASIWKALYEMKNDRLLIGSSRLAAGPCWSVRILSDDALATRSTINEVRELFYRAIGKQPTRLRR